LYSDAESPAGCREPEHFNDDANLGSAITDAVFCSNAVQGWGTGLKALTAEVESGSVLTLETLSLEKKKTDMPIWNGIGAVLQLGMLHTLRRVPCFPPLSLPRQPC